MKGRTGDLGIRFIRLTSLLFIWAVCPPTAIVLAAWTPRPRFDSSHPTTFTGDAAPHYYRAGSEEVNRLRSSIVPPPPPPPPRPRAPPRKHRPKRAPPHHGMKRRRRKEKEKKKSFKIARTVGYFFAGIAILLQVAVVVFLLIKRKQMIGVVQKYDEAAPTEWNGIHAPA